MDKKKRVLFVTGTRADFGKLKSLIRVVENAEEFDCTIFATGMHLLKRYGNTLKEIQKEKFSHVFPYFNQSDSTSKMMDIVLAETIKGLSYFVAENPVDLLIVHGDRVEALAGAIVGALQGIRTAHIEGGERTGTVDELIRHSVSKLAHIHFVATEENKARLIQMGEKEANIFIIGSPDIDIMLNGNLPSLDKVLKHYEIPFKDYGIFIYHPVVTEQNVLAEHIEEVVEALKLVKKNFIVIHPNNDLGSDIILKKINELKDLPNFKLFPSIRFENFLILIRNAQFIIGNSSCGIHEAPVYGVPTINIGTRQNKRFSSQSIMNVPEDKTKILKAISKLPQKFEPVYKYGKGDSASIFESIIKGEKIWNVSLQKFFLDLKEVE